MTPKRTPWLLALLIAKVAVAAESSAEDAKNSSVPLLQVQLSTQQRQLDAAETELSLLRTERAKAEAGLARATAAKVDEAGIRRALEDFRKDFEALFDVISSNNRLAYPALYDRMTKSLDRLKSGDGWADTLPTWPYEPHARNPSPVLDEVYSADDNRFSLASWDAFSALDGLYRPRGSKGSELHSDIEDAVKSAEGVVMGLAPDALIKLFQADHSKTVSAWQALVERLEAAIAAREQRIERARETINSISTELEARQMQKVAVDSRLNWAVMSMIVSLSLLFVSTRFFRPEVQAIIFQQRTLVEMVGMAFLLLTIIILGTDGKIDTSVLGTLLGTVGGYIFGQQVQARRGPLTENAHAAAQSQAPAGPSTQLAAAASMSAPALAAEAMPLPPQQAATNLQQAAQQGGEAAAQPGAAEPGPGAEGDRPAPPTGQP